MILNAVQIISKCVSFLNPECSSLFQMPLKLKIECCDHTFIAWLAWVQEKSIKRKYVIFLCYHPKPFFIFGEFLRSAKRGGHGHYEKQWLEQYNPGIEFCRRYVDDIVCLFNTEQGALSFYTYINNKFTMEKEENCKLPFLDVLLANFCSFAPFSYRLGLVHTLNDFLPLVRTFKFNN